jgi:hypothetical protein
LVAYQIYYQTIFYRPWLSEHKVRLAMAESEAILIDNRAAVINDGLKISSSQNDDSPFLVTKSQ